MMTDHDIEARLREALRVVAEATALDETTLPLVWEPARRRWRPVVVVAGAFAAALVAVGAVALIPAGDTEPAPPASPGVDPELRFPVLPSIPGVTGAWGDYSVPGEDAHRLELAVGTEVEGGFVDAIQVTVWPEYNLAFALEGDTVSIDDVEGVAVVSSPGEPPWVTLSWTVGDLWFLAHDPRGRLELVVEVAEALSVDPDAGFSDAVVMGALPVDLALLYPPTLIEPRPLPYVDAVADNAGAPAVQIAVSEAPSALALATRFENGDEVVVRGNPGYLMMRDGSLTIVWEELPGTVVTMTGASGLALGELLAVADGVQFVDEATWRSIYESDGPRPIPTTFVPPPTRAPNTTRAGP